MALKINLSSLLRAGGTAQCLGMILSVCPILYLLLNVIQLNVH